MSDTAQMAGNDPLVIAGVEYNSRLLVGSGKYKDLEETRLATEASGAEIITVETVALDVADSVMQCQAFIQVAVISIQQ